MRALTAIFTLTLIAFALVTISSAAPSQVSGVWLGTLQTFYCPGANCRPANLPLVLHITADSSRKLGVSLDNIDAGAMDLRGDNVVLEGSAFAFDIPSVQGNYRATISRDGNSLNGMWTQGIPLLLVFTRAKTPPGIVGMWEGDLGSCPLRVVLRVTADSASKLGVSLDSIDQGAMGLPGNKVVLKHNAFSFDVSSIDANYQGIFTADGYLKGELRSEGDTQPLIFTRISPAAAPTVVAVAARPPMALENLKAVLDEELKPVLEHGLLSKATGGGLVIGVLDRGERRIFAYGAARADSIFEIGSITKTFTGLILAQMTVQKKVSLNEPVRALLPPGFAGQPTAHEIRLVDLATHHSGLPRDAGNLNPKDPANPYADYHIRDLTEFLTQHGLAKPPKTKFLYSNIGFGLLGYALAQRAGLSYPKLLQSEVTGPLRMRDTIVALSPAQRRRLIQGYDADFNRSPAWDWDTVAGAGGLKSTASDMLTYLDANLHPEKYAAGAAPGSPLATLPMAVVLDHESRTDGGPGMQQALAWGIHPAEHTLSDVGGTYGYGSFALLNPHQDWAVIVLYNRGLREDPRFVDFLDRVTENLWALLGSGEPAPPIDFMCEADKRALGRLGIQ